MTEKSRSRSRHRMETLTEAVDRMARDGFTASFRAVSGGDLAAGDRTFAPEDLIVEEVARFEGMSDPADASVLFALRSPDDRVRGTFSSVYGIGADAQCVAALRRLEVETDAGRVSPRPGRGRS